MGRTANPINYDVPTRGQLAELLRGEKAGKTYDDLASLSGVSAATLKRAASGNTIPSEKVIDAFLEACGSDPRTARKAKSLRRHARRDELGGYTRPVRPVTINTGDKLADALIDTYRNAGAPTYREMQTRAGGAYLISLSTISRILHRQTLPVDTQQMVAFLKGCNVARRDHGEWIEAWRRVHEHSSNQAGTQAALSIIDAIQNVMSELRIDSASLAAGMASAVVAAAKSANQINTGVLEAFENVRLDTPELTAGLASVVETAEKRLMSVPPYDAMTLPPTAHEKAA
ncbi:helix-turn-helix domain-containing protein [Streptomyces sp. NPDC057675]|uniref:helix-turn-helix domain-containing protein n=1 Tax=Streptomyces sp. NPDC057675 TaxID=3346204 RepID=UPI00367AA289